MSPAAIFAADRSAIEESHVSFLETLKIGIVVGIPEVSVR